MKEVADTTKETEARLAVAGSAAVTAGGTSKRLRTTRAATEAAETARHEAVAGLAEQVSLAAHLVKLVLTAPRRLLATGAKASDRQQEAAEQLVLLHDDVSAVGRYATRGFVSELAAVAAEDAAAVAAEGTEGYEYHYIPGTTAWRPLRPEIPTIGEILLVGDVGWALFRAAVASIVRAGVGLFP